MAKQSAVDRVVNNSIIKSCERFGVTPPWKVPISEALAEELRRAYETFKKLHRNPTEKQFLEMIRASGRLFRMFRWLKFVVESGGFAAVSRVMMAVDVALMEASLFRLPTTAITVP